MKSNLLRSILLFVLVTPVFSETRTLGIKIEKTGSAEPKVSIFSDVKEEDKRGLSIVEAVSILDSAPGWGSSVEVGVVADHVALRDYLPILEAISKNVWLELVFVVDQNPSFIAENIRKRIRGEK